MHASSIFIPVSISKVSEFPNAIVLKFNGFQENSGVCIDPQDTYREEDSQYILATSGFACTQMGYSYGLPIFVRRSSPSDGLLSALFCSGEETYMVECDPVVCVSKYTLHVYCVSGELF